MSSHTWPPLASLGRIAGERGSLAEASNRERFEQESIASHMLAVGQRRPYLIHRLLAYHAPAVRAATPYGDQAGAVSSAGLSVGRVWPVSSAFIT